MKTQHLIVIILLMHTICSILSAEIKFGMALSSFVTSTSMLCNEKIQSKFGNRVQKLNFASFSEGPAYTHVYGNTKIRGIRAGAAGLDLSKNPQRLGDIVAKVLGYIMGFGAVAVYLPIVLKLLSGKSADGLSLQTWICNLLGLTMATFYPFKKGFPFSTYIELLTVAVQSSFILFLICMYNGQLVQFMFGFTAFAASLVAVSNMQIPANALNAIQVLSILICNYANVPQIVLTVSTSLTKPVNAQLPFASCSSNARKLRGAG